MAVLDRLVEIGMAIAETAGRDAAAPAEERTLADPALTFSRAARAVRLTIALQQRLDEDLEKQGKAEADKRRTRIGHLVERVIEAENDGEGEDYELTAAAWEQLTEYEKLDEVVGRPVGEVVARICAALGLSDEACAEVMEAWAPDDPPHPLSPLIPAEAGTQVLAAASPMKQKSLGPGFRRDERILGEGDDLWLPMRGRETGPDG